MFACIACVRSYLRLYSPISSLFSFVLLCSSLSFSVLLCPPLSFSVLLCPSLSFSVLLCPRPSPSLSPTVCPHLPVPPSVPISLSVPCHPAQHSTSASNPVRTQSVHSLPLGGSFGRNRAIDYPSGRNRGRIRPFRPPNHGFRPNEPHSRATHPRIRSPTRLVLGQGKRLDCANG